MPPLNDNIADAEVISGASGTVDGDNTAATYETGEDAVLGGPWGTNTVWYAWTAPDASDITFWTTAVDDSCSYVGLGDSVLSVIDGNDFATSALVVQDDDASCGNWSEVVLVAPTPGHTYYIAVQGYDNPNVGAFRLHWAPPPCAYGATTEAADGITSHSAVGHATLCNPSDISRYRFEYGTTAGYGSATAYFPIGVDLSPQAVSAILAECGSGLAPSTTYHYRVRITGPGGTVNGADETFVTSAPGSAPANDDIGSATAIGGASGSADGDNTDATLEAAEGALLYDVDNSIPGTDLGYGGGRSQWWAWTAPATGDYGFWVESRNGRDYLGHIVFDGLCDPILTILDGNDFATAVVVAQNEYSEGQQGGQYPWSLAQFHATAGHVYYIAVDGYNGTPPSGGGYDVANTQVGPFTLHWGGAVCARIYMRNFTILSHDDTTITAQFDVYPDDPAGADYWLRCSPPGTDGAHGHEDTGFAWATVVATHVGLTPNTNISTRGGASNSCDSVDSDVVYVVTDIGGFAACPELLDDFDQADCTAPVNFDTSYTPGTADIRIFGNEVGIYRCDSYVRAYREGDPFLGASPFLSAADLWITLAVVDDKQDVGWGGGAYVGDWFARSDSDAGEAQIIYWDGVTDNIIASVAQIFVDGDKLGFRWWSNGDLTAYRYHAGVWTSLVTAAGAVPLGTRPPYNNFAPLIGQGQDEAPPTISAGDLFDLTSYGTTPAPVSSGCPEGTDKYVWSQAQWRCGYYGDSNGGCVPPIDCQHYWLGLTVFPHGRLDCYNDTWSMGDAPYPTAVFGDFGTGYAALPFYPQSPDYDTTFDYFDGLFGGFYVYDSDFAYKCYAAIQSSIDSVAAAFAGQGATIITCTDPGNSKVSRGVIMPVPPSVGRMDDLWFSDGRCAPTRVFRPQIVRYK